MAAFLFPVLEIQFHIFARTPVIVAELIFFSQSFQASATDRLLPYPFQFVSPIY
jgi:hypothetical protein